MSLGPSAWGPEGAPTSFRRARRRRFDAHELAPPARTLRGWRSWAAPPGRAVRVHRRRPGVHRGGFFSPRRADGRRRPAASQSPAARSLAAFARDLVCPVQGPLHGEAE
eukprot:7945120-Pyramimonas_sp.AAC.1